VHVKGGAFDTQQLFKVSPDFQVVAACVSALVVVCAGSAVDIELVYVG
jgi:hypothetical protein